MSTPVADDAKTCNDEATVESKFAEFMGMLLKLLDNENMEDRDRVDDVFGEIPEDEKVLDLLYEVLKKEGSPDQLRAQILQFMSGVIYRSGKRILSSMKVDKLEEMCNELLEIAQIEANGHVKRELCLIIGYIAEKRNDAWPTLRKFLQDGIASGDPSKQQKALGLIGGSYMQLCEWSEVRELVIQSIMNDYSALCKNAIKALDSFVRSDPKFDDECLPMVVPMIIKFAEMGCCAPPTDSGHYDLKCDAVHAAAIECLDTLIRKTRGYVLSNDLIARVFEVCIETLLNGADCEKESTHCTALLMMYMISEHHSDLISASIVPDIVISCLQYIANKAKETNEWKTSNPAYKEDHFEMGIWSSGYVKLIIERIGVEKMDNHLLSLSQQFFKDGDANRRTAALIAWHVADDGWRMDNAAFLVECATTALSDEYPRVRDAAVRLLSRLFSMGMATGGPEQLQKLVDSLVALATTDSIPRVRANALMALSYFKSYTDHISPHFAVLLPLLTTIIAECPSNSPKTLHMYAINLIAKLANAVGWEGFQSDFAAVESAICSLLKSLDPSSRYFKSLCKGAKRICSVVQIDSDLQREIESIEQIN